MNIKKIKDTEMMGFKMTQYEAGELAILESFDSMPTIADVQQQFGTFMTQPGTYHHISVSHKTRYPSWEELKELKDFFFKDNFAFQVFPPKSHYTNVHPNCFHLWSFQL